MQETGYDIWGFVIYRTTYSSDADWEDFLYRLRVRMERSFDRCNGRDILDRFALTVFSDPAQFDGADTNAIRAHFRQWSESAMQSERLPLELRVANAEKAGFQLTDYPPTRHQFCIQVDEESLHSVVYDAAAPPKPDIAGVGWVKLISKSWIPIEIDPNRRPGWEAACAYPPIEGVTERDVGWEKIRYTGTTHEHYSGDMTGLVGARTNGWMYDYCRPPGVG